jgi:hypothetical protein
MPDLLTGTTGSASRESVEKMRSLVTDVQLIDGTRGVLSMLNRALTVEFAFIAGFVGLAFRSVRIGLACLPSGIFPIVAAGSVLRLLGSK